MSDLRQLLGTLGLEGGQTLLQSGNVVFRSRVSVGGQARTAAEDGRRSSWR